MADSSEHLGAIRDDMKNLRDEVAGLAQSIGAKNREAIESLGSMISGQLGQLDLLSGDGAKKALDTGQAALDQLCEHVRKNPASSLLAAFGAGAILAALLRK